MLTEETIDQFNAEGVVLVPNVLEKKWLDLIAQGIEKNKESRGEWSCDYTQPGDTGEFWDDYCNWQRFNEYRDCLLYTSPSPRDS